MTVGKTIKKVCVVLGNWTGFAVHGTFFSYTQGAHILANLGVDVFRIERLISSFGVPRPVTVISCAFTEFFTAFPDQSFKSPLVELVHQTGDLFKLPDVFVEFVCNAIDECQKAISCFL